MKNKSIWIRLNDDIDDPFNKSNVLRNKETYEKHNHFHEKNCRVVYDHQNFKCRQCGFFVTANRELSGVNNRNHCPRCLWSRHMDLITPGDRRSDCQSRMEPIGLTLKEIQKRYGQDQGELMVIHHCKGCGKYSINRIAADDDTQVIYHLYMESLLIDREVKRQLHTEGIRMLGAGDQPIIRAQLFGRVNDPLDVRLEDGLEENPSLLVMNVEN